MKWITNDPAAAKALKAADVAYETAKRAAGALPLQAKVEALRKAKADRQAAYERAVMAETYPAKSGLRNA